MYMDNEAFLFEMPVRIILTCSSELLQKSTGAYSFPLSLLGIVNTLYSSYLQFGVGECIKHLEWGENQYKIVQNILVNKTCQFIV